MAVLERKLSELQLIEQAQPREKINLEVVADYAEILKAGNQNPPRNLPPIICFGKFVADGFHRHLGYQSAGRLTIPTITHEGGMREAILYSCGANSTHGLRRTSADKRRAVVKLLKDAEWRKWSDRRIAERAGVEHHLVAGLRATLSGGIPQIERQAERGGTEYNVSLRPEPQPRPDNTVKRIVSAILLLAKADADNFDRGLTEPQRARLHDGSPSELVKARTFLDSL